MSVPEGTAVSLFRITEPKVGAGTTSTVSPGKKSDAALADSLQQF